jgi:hypothetical protein
MRGPDQDRRGNGSPPLPSQRINPDLLLARDADQIDLLARMLRRGDPLADAVIAEVRELGPGGQDSLDAALRNGPGMPRSVPPAIQAFLQEVETVPDWVDPAILQRGSTAVRSTDPLWTDVVAGLGTGLHTFSSPAIARLLVGTGRLVSQVAHRARETGTWYLNTMLPGGLTLGAPGYLATLQVRLLHAVRRVTTLKRGWDVEAWGVPINQVDMAFAWVDFNYVPLRALTSFGFDFTEDERRECYHLCRYIAYLIGLDPVFYRDVQDHPQAEDLLTLLDTTNGAPDEHSRDLTASQLELSIGTVMNALKTPPALSGDLVHAMARFIHGDAIADGLGVRRTELTHLMPLVAHDNQSTRRLQRMVPGVWQQMLEQNLATFRAALAAPGGPSEYQTFLRAPAGK